jgi:hypothetical protein
VQWDPERVMTLVDGAAEELIAPFAKHWIGYEWIWDSVDTSLSASIFFRSFDVESYFFL